jgi:hypothetical protein
MDSFKKDIRKLMLRDFKAEGGYLFHFPDHGIVIAVKPCIQGDRCRFVRVAAAQCSDGDTYKRKIGELVALTALDEGRSVSVDTWGYTGIGIDIEDTETLFSYIAESFVNFLQNI